MLLDAEKMNQDVKAWFALTEKVLKRQFDLLDIKHVPRSPSPVASREVLEHILRKRLGLVSKGSFKFPRHMVFVAKGVGRGVPAAVAGTNQTTRKPKDWFNGVIDARIDELANTVAENSGNLIVNNLKIK